MTRIASAGALRADADQLAVVYQITAELLETVRDEGQDVVETALQSIPGIATSAFLIALEHAARSANPAVAIADLLAALADTGWADECAAVLSGAGRIGVGSMGTTTRAVLEAVAERDRSMPQIIVPDVAVARGIGYLNVPLYTGDIAAGDVLLLSAVASHETTVWTSRRIADASTAARRRNVTLVPAVHPVAELNTAAHRRFRPPSGIEPVDVN